MKKLTFLCLFWVSTAFAFEGDWISDRDTNCQVWNPNPVQGESIKWSGKCLSGKATGLGVLQWFLNGKIAERYEGEYRDGKANGKGVFTGVDGSRYEGEYREGKVNGKGVYVWANGSQYDGEYSDGKFHGFGTLTLIRGNSSILTWEKAGIGKWLDDKFIVQGIFNMQKFVRTCNSVDDCKNKELAAATQPEGINDKNALVWAKCPIGMNFESGTCIGKANEFTWREAMVAARENRLDGYANWRLPTVDELAPSDAQLLRDKTLAFGVHCVVHPVITPVSSTISTFNGNAFVTFWTESGFSSEDRTKAAFVHDVHVCVPRSSKYSDNLIPSAYRTVSGTNWFPTYRDRKDPSFTRGSWDSTSLGFNYGSGKAYVFLVRGATEGDLHRVGLAQIATVERAEQEIRAKQERETQAARQREAAEQAERAARVEREERAFNSLLRAKTVREMYLGAITYEDQGDRGRAKSVYRELIKRFPNANEALLASQRLTSLSDVEAVEASGQRAAQASQASRNALDNLRKANYTQCMNERMACTNLCSGISRGSCESKCQVCTQ